MGFSDTMRILLSIVLISLNVLGFAVGIVLMSLAAWIFVTYSSSPSFFETIYGVDIYEVLIFFMASGSFFAVVSILGLFAGVFSLIRRLRCFAVALLLLYSALLFALYTFQVISVTLDFSQFFEGKDKINDTVKAAFDDLVMNDAGFSSSSAQVFSAWQSSYQCCGWLNHTEYTSSPLATNNTDWRPMSCCGDRNTTIYPTCDPWTPTFYNTSCDASFVRSYSNISWAFIAMSVALAVIEALVLALTFFLIGFAKCSGSRPEKEE